MSINSSRPGFLHSRSQIALLAPQAAPSGCMVPCSASDRKKNKKVALPIYKMTTMTSHIGKRPSRNQTLSLRFFFNLQYKSHATCDSSHIYQSYRSSAHACTSRPCAFNVTAFHCLQCRGPPEHQQLHEPTSRLKCGFIHWHRSIGFRTKRQPCSTAPRQSMLCPVLCMHSSISYLVWRLSELHLRSTTQVDDSFATLPHVKS